MNTMHKLTLILVSICFLTLSTPAMVLAQSAKALPGPPARKAAPAAAAAPAQPAAPGPIRRTGGGGPTTPKATGCPFGEIKDAESGKERCKTVEEHDEELIAKIGTSFEQANGEEVAKSVWGYTITLVLLFMAALLAIAFYFRKQLKTAQEAKEAAEAAVSAAEAAQGRVAGLEAALAQAGQNGSSRAA